MGGKRGAKKKRKCAQHTSPSKKKTHAAARRLHRRPRVQAAPPHGGGRCRGAAQGGAGERGGGGENCPSCPCPSRSRPAPFSPPKQDNALDAAAYARESGEAAYLERDPADRPPPSAFIAFYEAAALRALEAALAALPPDAAADARVADAMLARDRLAASVGRSGAGEEAWPE